MTMPCFVRFVSRFAVRVFCVFGLFILTHCGGKPEGGPLRATVTGLSSGEVVTFTYYLNGNFTAPATASITGTGETSLTANLKDEVIEGTTYLVRVTTPPTGKICTVETRTDNSSLAYDLVRDGGETVLVLCSETSHAIAGTINGLADDHSVSLVVNGDFTTTLSQNGAFTVEGNIADGAAYEITLFDQSLNQRCALPATTGTATADLDLDITCTYANFHFSYPSRDNTRLQNFTGNIGGREAADAYCNTVYTEEYATTMSCDAVTAFLSVDADDEIRDIPSLHPEMNPDLPIYTMDDITGNPRFYNDDFIDIKMADNWADLLDGSLDGGSRARTSWSGSASDGSLSGDACSGWTSTSGTTTATGYLSAGSSWLTQSKDCSASLTLSCFCMQNQSSSTVSIGGTVTGLTAGTLSLLLNEGDADEQTLDVTADGAFTFDVELTRGDTYTVTVESSLDLLACDITNETGTADTDVTNIAIVCHGTANALFPTDTAIAADFGARDAADLLCEATYAATYADSLPCDSVHAFVSYDAADEIQDIPTLFGLDESLAILDAAHDNTHIADDWADLLDGSIDNPLTVDWWSGSSSAGETAIFNCMNWTDPTGDAIIGRAGEVGFLWTGVSDGDCADTARLMCVCVQE